MSKDTQQENSNSFPRDEEVIRKVRKLMDEDGLTETMRNRYVILLAMMDQLSDAEIVKKYCFSKATVSKVRKLYLESGLEGLELKSRKGNGPTPVYENDYDCRLGFTCDGQALVALMISDNCLGAVFRTGSLFRYANTGLGTIHVKGKGNVQIMDAAAQNGCVDLVQALGIMVLSTYKNRNYSSPSSKMYEFLSDFLSQCASPQDSYKAIICLQKREWDFVSFYDELLQRIDIPLSSLSEEEWFDQVGSMLAGQHTSDQKAETIQGLVEAIRLYYHMRAEDTLPFIWKEKKAEPVDVADQANGSSDVQEQRGTVEKKKNRSFANVAIEIPELNPGDSALLLQLLLLNNTGRETTCHVLQKFQNVPSVETQAFGNISDIEKSLYEMDKALGKMSREMKNDMIQMVFNICLRHLKVI